MLADFFVDGEATLGALADIYGLRIAPEHGKVPLVDHFANELKRPVKAGDIVQLGPIALLAHAVADGRVKTVGLQLADPDEGRPMTIARFVMRLVKPLLRRGRQYVLERVPFKQN